MNYIINIYHSKEIKVYGPPDLELFKWVLWFFFNFNLILVLGHDLFSVPCKLSGNGTENNYLIR